MCTANPRYSAIASQHVAASTTTMVPPRNAISSFENLRSQYQHQMLRGPDTTILPGIVGSAVSPPYFEVSATSSDRTAQLQKKMNGVEDVHRQWQKEMQQR